MKEFLKDLVERIFRTETLIMLSAVIAAIINANMLPPESAIYKAVMVVAAVLGALGYGAMRTSNKNKELEANKK